MLHWTIHCFNYSSMQEELMGMINKPLQKLAIDIQIVMDNEKVIHFTHFSQTQR